MKRNLQAHQGPLARKSKETLKEKVHRHIHDKNDVITDEDIRDAITGSEGPGQAQKMANEVPGRKHITPWDINSEGYDEE